MAGAGYAYLPTLVPQLSLHFSFNWIAVVAGGGHEPKDGALQGTSALDYLKLAASIAVRELKEESYDTVEGFEDVSLSLFLILIPHVAH